MDANGREYLIGGNRRLSERILGFGIGKKADADERESDFQTQ